jgi:hypothetical protein
MNFLKELSVFNRIKFVEQTHSYFIDGQPTNSPSVTQLLKRFKREFDSNKAATRVAKKAGVTKETILADWQANNLFSTTIGSMLHKYIENFYNNKKIAYEGSLLNLTFDQKKKLEEAFPIMVKHFQNFYENNKHLHCVKSEMVVGDVDDTKVCGTSDMFCYNDKTSLFEILDFKTNKKMNKTTSYGNLLYPFDDMTEGEINEYTIQLNVYKYLIEKYTNIKIEALKIIWMNPNNPDYQIFVLDNIQDKIALMMQHFKSASLFAKI